MNISDIHIRDPFVLPLAESGFYYLFGSTDKDVWKGPGVGFDCYRSRDLQEWEGPIAAFCPPPDFWATTQFWAPEVHFHDGRYFMFASFKAHQKFRGTQILVSHQPEGPYEIWSNGPVTPAHWECLDGTLHLDEDKNPWIVFCHEWTQVHDGAIYATRLSSDLKQAEGRPIFLFNASEAPWVEPSAWPGETAENRFPKYVTDGPFLFRTAIGALQMLWSSFGKQGYAIGIAHSQSGTVSGSWTQEPKPLNAADGGHAMIFRAFDGRRFLVFHQPNNTPYERTVFREVAEENDLIYLSAAR